MTDYSVLALAVVLLVLGYLLGVGILTTIGWIALAVGAVLALLAIAGRPVLGRRRRSRL